LFQQRFFFGVVLLFSADLEDFAGGVFFVFLSVLGVFGSSVLSLVDLSVLGDVFFAPLLEVGCFGLVSAVFCFLALLPVFLEAGGSLRFFVGFGSSVVSCFGFADTLDFPSSLVLDDSFWSFSFSAIALYGFLSSSDMSSHSFFIAWVILGPFIDGSFACISFRLTCAKNP